MIRPIEEPAAEVDPELTATIERLQSMPCYDGITVDPRIVPCRFDHNTPAVGRYKTPDGCVCYPDDREQDLCAQHVIKNGMIGDRVALVVIYEPFFYAGAYQ